MGRIRVWAGAAVLVLAASTAFAESRNITPAFETCMDKADGVTAATLACMATEHGVQDKRLNAAYKAAMKTAGAQRSDSLKEAQRAWLKFRDLNCAFFGGGEGTIAGVIAASCLMQTTAERADELQIFAESP